MNSIEYALGNTDDAGRRLAIQDQQFAYSSEILLDQLQIQPDDHVVEVGMGPGGLSRRILSRLGPNGKLVGVDYTQSLLDQATRNLQGVGQAAFEPVRADIQEFGDWLQGATVVVGRTILHHLPFGELWLGELTRHVPANTRVGFIEPEFRAPLTGIGALPKTEETETLRIWAEAINRMYSMRDISPCLGATLSLSMEIAEFQDVHYVWQPAPVDQSTIDNMLMLYEEVREKYVAMGIMTEAELDAQIERVRRLPAEGLPSIWGVHVVTARTPSDR